MNNLSTITIAGMLTLGLAGCGSTATTGNPDQNTSKQVTLETYSNSPLISTPDSGVEIAFAAYQDGDGHWAPLARVNGKYTFTVKDAKGQYAIAYRCPAPLPGSNTPTQILAFTTGELLRPAVVCGNSRYDSTSPRATLTVNVTGATRDGSLGITEVGSQPKPYQGWLTHFSAETGRGAERVRNGLVNLSVVEPGTSSTAGRMAVVKNIDVQADKTINIDLNTQSFALEQRKLTFQGISANEEAYLHHSYTEGAPNTSATVLAGLSRGYWASDTPASLHLDVVPGARQTPTSLHYAELRASKRISDVSTYTRYATAFMRQPRDLTFTLPSAPAINVTRVGTAGTTRLKTDFGTSNLNLATLSAYTSDGTSLASVSAMITRGWLAGAQQFTLPDLSGVQGWNTSWNLDMTSQVSWHGSVVQSNNSVAIYAFVGVDASMGDYATLVGKLDGAVVTSATAGGTLGTLP